MSGTSSDAATAAGITDRPSDLAISDSNKKPRSEDQDGWHWLNSHNALDEAYEMLTSPDILSPMVRGRIRLEGLLSKATELDLRGRLKKLLCSLKDLLTSVTNLGADEDVLEKLRLVCLAKGVLQEWESIENVIPLPVPGSCLSMVPTDYPDAVPSAWLFEYHWRDDAHKEVVSIRKKYSYLLDEAYRNSYTSYLEKHGISGSTTLLHKKLLNFMASSREDFDFLLVEKCYKWVMSIKKCCTLMLLASLSASEKLTDQTKLPNWRDDIYEQVAAYRKMYSLELDKLLRDEVNKIQSATLDEANEAQYSSLEEALQFLASSRDVIAILKEDYCRKQLAAIKQMEDAGVFLSAKQSTPPDQTGLSSRPTNWRDVEYVALQNKAFRFTYEVHDVYLKHKSVWSEMQACDEDLKELESRMKSVFEIYRMSRGEMSMLCESEYFDLCLGRLKEDVEACIALIKLLLEKEGTEPGWDLDRAHLLIPKPCKFVRCCS